MIKRPTDALVSVIIVNWNGVDWLGKCIDSILCQTYKRIEVIVVDNASSDNSVAFMQRHYGSKVRVICSATNLGFAGGNNLGIAQANGDLILLFNTDAWAKPDMVASLVGYKQRHPRLGVVAPFESGYSTGSEREQYRQIDLLGHPVNFAKPTQVFFLSGVCILFDKHLYAQTGGLDGNFFMYSEEIDWFWRLRLMRIAVASVPGQYVYHHGAGSTGRGIRVNSFLWRNQNTLQMLIKNYRAYNLFWVLPLYIVQNIAEAVVFLLVLKPHIAATYPRGWWFNIIHLPRTLRSRRAVQAMRSVSDRQVMAAMYHGSAKLRHLVHYIKVTRT